MSTSRNFITLIFASDVDYDTVTNGYKIQRTCFGPWWHIFQGWIIAYLTSADASYLSLDDGSMSKVCLNFSASIVQKCHTYKNMNIHMRRG